LENRILFAQQLNGTIGESIGNLERLTSLCVFFVFPDTNKKFCSMIENFRQIGHNQLGGSLPRSFFKLSSLEEVFLQNNQISGGLPMDFGRFSNLTHLYFIILSLE
jgi:Leucine-rich repeat (LRR) protein